MARLIELGFFLHLCLVVRHSYQWVIQLLLLARMYSRAALLSTLSFSNTTSCIFTQTFSALEQTHHQNTRLSWSAIGYPLLRSSSG